MQRRPDAFRPLSSLWASDVEGEELSDFEDYKINTDVDAMTSSRPRHEAAVAVARAQHFHSNWRHPLPRKCVEMFTRVPASRQDTRG
jgi:hypothetical protein